MFSKSQTSRSRLVSSTCRLKYPPFPSHPTLLFSAYPYRKFIDKRDWAGSAVAGVTGHGLIICRSTCCSVIFVVIRIGCCASRTSVVTVCRTTWNKKQHKTNVLGRKFSQTTSLTFNQEGRTNLYKQYFLSGVQRDSPYSCSPRLM